ncbi:hypothetical protein AA309_14090 [Microvirga vignae]|uniref:Uncharacterized protein n=1 Tax=Microvirga vignae TaxID=1225564 RepID=A0A0H1RB81_9HYPH|nr:hypothetical protein [Microvirga vignae]KLK92463.1 hypothetical protein AA309_14090 [Microvirga vignae]
MITKALLVTVTAIVTALYLSAFRVQAANESPLVTMEWLERNLGDPKHCEPIRIGPDLAKKPTEVYGQTQRLKVSAA